MKLSTQNKKATESLMKKTTKKELWIGSNFHFNFFWSLHPPANVKKIYKKNEYKTIPLSNQYQLLIQRMKQLKNVMIIFFLGFLLARKIKNLLIIVCSWLLIQHLHYLLVSDPFHLFVYHLNLKFNSLPLEFHANVIKFVVCCKNKTLK